ncbi:MAG TPA: hypothetical protein DIT88_09815 [Planctomycetaceae bacterium]|nr:hypothetical protein [Planctomycetaceae bacterium]
MKNPLFKRIAVALLALTLVLPATVKAERPSAPRLLPYNTVLYMRIHSVPEFLDKFDETSFGSIKTDPAVQPIWDQFYNDLISAFPQIEEELGVSLEDLLDIPQGELSISLSVTDTGTPMFAMIADVGENTENVAKLIERAEFEQIENAGDLEEQVIGETEVTIFRQPGDDDDVVVFNKDESVVICSSEIMAEHLIAVWEGTATDADRVLADNRKFTDIMRSSVGTGGELPHMSWYADPYTLVNALTRDNFSAQAVIALLPTLGVDGFKAFGGSVIMAPEGFDSISHFHIALGSPRRGILNLITLGEGEMTPEPWIPADVVDYTTVYWDFEKTYAELTTLVDSILGEGYFENLVETNVNIPAAIDLKADIIEQLGGRVTLIGKVIPPARVNSYSRLIAIKLSEESELPDTADELFANYPFLSQEDHKGTPYYRIAGPQPRPNPAGAQQNTSAQDAPEDAQNSFRRPTPSLAFYNGYLLVTDAEEMLIDVIETGSGALENLASQEDYQIVAEELSKQSREDSPSMVSFTRPELALKMVFDLVTGENAQGFIAENAESNPLFGALDRAYTDHGIPDYEEIAKYLAPSGALLFNKETGLHFISFSLKPAQP